LKNWRNLRGQQMRPHSQARDVPALRLQILDKVVGPVALAMSP